MQKTTANIRTLSSSIEKLKGTQGGHKSSTKLHRELQCLVETGRCLPDLHSFARDHQKAGVLGDLELEIRDGYRLPSVIYASSVLNTPLKAARAAFKVGVHEMRAAQSLTIESGQRLGAFSFAVRESESWVADVLASTERLTVVLEQRAAEDLLLAVMEGYRVKHKPNPYTEVYGMCIGHARRVATSNRVSGRTTECYVDVVRCVPQLRAQGYKNHVLPKKESVELLIDVADQVVPHLEVLGDFHSHPYRDVSTLKAARGWEYSRDDQSSNLLWYETLAKRKHRMRVGFVVAVAAKGNSRETPEVDRYGKNTHQLTIHGCQVVIAAYRVKVDGTYDSNLRLHTSLARIG